MKFTNNNSNKNSVSCPQCQSSIIINDEYPHGVSAFQDNYEVECPSCGSNNPYEYKE